MYNEDKEFMTTQLRMLRREYRKNKKSNKFLQLQQKFDEMKEAKG
jgi:hypothetical protein